MHQKMLAGWKLEEMSGKAVKQTRGWLANASLFESKGFWAFGGGFGGSPPVCISMDSLRFSNYTMKVYSVALELSKQAPGRLAGIVIDENSSTSRGVRYATQARDADSRTCSGIIKAGAAPACRHPGS